MREIDPGDVRSLHIGCVHGRYRVRRELGLPLDLHDEASDEIKCWAAEQRG